MPIRSRLGAALACAALAGLTTSAHTSQIAPTAVDRVDFSFQIRPLLSDRCFRCHGPDASKRKAKLRLDTREGAFKEIEDGWAIVKPGDPGKSELIRRINSYLEDDVMPPSESHLSLSEAEKALLKRWVAEGADYKPHWSLIPVHAVAVPTVGDGPAKAGHYEASRPQPGVASGFSRADDASRQQQPGVASGFSRADDASRQQQPGVVSGFSRTNANPIDAFVRERLERDACGPSEARSR